MQKERATLCHLELRVGMFLDYFVSRFLASFIHESIAYVCVYVQLCCVKWPAQYVSRSGLQLDVRNLSLGMRYFVNAYEVKAGIGVISGKTV